MSVIITVILVLLIFFLFSRLCFGPPKYKKRYVYDRDADEKSLNDIDIIDKHVARLPVYEDTMRINNQIYWMSDYSDAQLDSDRKSLNDDVITPVRGVSGGSAIKYHSGMHKLSRFGCEKS